MSKLSDKSIGKSSIDRKGIDSDSSYKRHSCIRYTIYKNFPLQLEPHPYLSHQTIIKRFGSTLWVTNNWLIAKVIKMTSRNKAITAIIPWTTNSKDSTVFTRFIDLCNCSGNTKSSQFHKLINTEAKRTHEQLIDFCSFLLL
nr:hypothetical protein Iba_chr09dCG15780 [Ipomoea batatas]